MDSEPEVDSKDDSSSDNTIKVQGRTRSQRPSEQNPRLQMEEKPKLEWNDDSDSDLSESECMPNSIKSIECFICGAQMAKIYKLRDHMRRCHADKSVFDDAKAKQLETAPIYSTLNPHERNIEPLVIRDFIVQEVREKRHSQFYGILSEAGVELHISDSETESEEETDDDAAKTIPRNTYKCSKCSMNFDRRYKALLHQKTQHFREQLPFACPKCGRSFCGVQLLIHHLKTQCENDEHPISCMERFRQHLLKSNLQQLESLSQVRKAIKIQRLKTAEKVYGCSVCSKTFLRPEHLTRHKAVHLPEEQKMDCPVCFKKFNRKDNLRTHMKVHMDEAERDATNNQSIILCQLCGHCFTSKSNYVVHMRRHTGEMPYTCEVCGKGFPKSTDLNSHKITHTGERNFKCKICQKAFARPAVLSKHMRVHAGPFHCTYCEQSFTRPNQLATHLLRHHANASVQPTVAQSDKSTPDLTPNTLTNTSEKTQPVSDIETYNQNQNTYSQGADPESLYPTQWQS